MTYEEYNKVFFTYLKSEQTGLSEICNLYVTRSRSLHGNAYNMLVNKIQSNFDSSTIKLIEELLKNIYPLIVVNRDNDNCLDNQNEFDYLIVMLASYSQYRMKKELNIIELSKAVMKHYVSKSKKHGFNFGILKFFDNDGNLLLRKRFEYKYYTNDIIKKYVKYYRMPNFLKNNPDIEIFVSNDELDELKAIFDKEREENEILKEKNIQEKKKELESRKRTLQVTELRKNKNTNYNNPEYLTLLNYYNPTTKKLKPGCTSKIKRNELVELLKKFVNDEECKACILEYDLQVNKIRVDCIKRILGKSEYRKLETILKTIDDENIFKIEYYEFIGNDNFNNLDEKEVKQRINELTNLMLKPSNNIVNLIVFPNNNFLEEKKNEFMSIKAHATNETILKAANTQLHMLQTNSLDSLKSSLGSAFHTLQRDNNPFKIDKLKGYRFGARKAKTCIFVLSVNEYNQKILQKQYNIDATGNVILVFGIGNVTIERENDMYEKHKKNAIDNKDTLIRIYDIFANPFTPETLPIALELIESGINQIDEFTRESGYQKSK